MGNGTNGSATGAYLDASGAGHAEPKRVALFGAGSVLGKALLKRLATLPSVERILAVDADADGPIDPHVRAVPVDPAKAGQARTFAKILAEERVGVVLSTLGDDLPIRRVTASHALESHGALQLVEACRFAGVKRLICRGSLLVYGSGAVDEDSPLRGALTEPLIANKREAELEFDRFSTLPASSRLVLRLAPLLAHDGLLHGPSLRRLLALLPAQAEQVPVSTVALAVEAFIAGLEQSVSGAVDIVSGAARWAELRRAMGPAKAPAPRVATRLRSRFGGSPSETLAAAYAALAVPRAARQCAALGLPPPAPVGPEQLQRALRG